MRKISLIACLVLLLGITVMPAAADSDPFIQLVATDVTLDETEFTYTGEEIRPNVTVRCNGQLLTLDKDYYLDYADNIEVGEAKVIVTGIATAGYAGTVEHPFFILERETEPSEPETSEPTQPETTEPTQPETSEPTQPETSEPTQPESTEPTQPETTEPAKPVYKITKGNKASWTQGSQSGLSFTADGPFADFQGISVDGKKLDKTHFEAKEGTTVLLKTAFLNTLKTGEHKITLHFAEADAEGTFTVAAAGENPKTGDVIGLWLGTMLITGTAICLVSKKRA